MVLMAQDLIVCMLWIIGSGLHIYKIHFMYLTAKYWINKIKTSILYTLVCMYMYMCLCIDRNHSIKLCSHRISGSHQSLQMLRVKSSNCVCFNDTAFFGGHFGRLSPDAAYSVSVPICTRDVPMFHSRSYVA